MISKTGKRSRDNKRRNRREVKKNGVGGRRESRSSKR